MAEMDFSADDHRFMAQAIRLARRGLYSTDPNPRVGCVLVRDGRIVGEGWHQKAGGPHAEVHALDDAGSAHARGATAYISLEPCSHHGRTPPCSAALIKAGVERVVAAMLDPNPLVAGKGMAQLAEAGIRVEHGLLQDQARELNPGYIKRMQYGRPFVRSKLAMSLDGRTALASGESKWITGPAAREDVHRLRARSSVILTGVGTVLADDPSLSARLSETLPETHQPWRVVLDTHLSMPETAKMLGLPGRTLVMTCCEEDGLAEPLRRAGAEVIVMPSCNGAVDPAAVLDYLGQQEVNEVMLEMGATLSGSFLRQGLVDEILIYMAAVLMGHEARPLFRLPGIDSMDKKVPLRITDMRRVGDDWRISAVPVKVHND